MPRILKILVRVLGLVALLLVALLLALHMFLNVWLHLLVNKYPERFLMSYSSAWMLHPGEIHVKNLELRQQGLRDQWLLTVDRATLALDLAALNDHTFHVTGADASGATWRWRARLDAVTLPEPPAAIARPPDPDATPPIPGLSNPPDPIPEAIYPKGRPWRVVLDEVDIADVREIWVGDYRFEGSARVSGSRALEARKWLEAEGVVLTVEDGQLLRGDLSMLTGIEGVTRFDYLGTKPEAMAGRSQLNAISGEVGLTADVRDLQFLDYYLRAAPWLQLTGGTGTLAVDLHLQDGAFLEGSRVQVDVGDIQAQILSHTVVGDGVIEILVDTVEGLPQASLRVDFLDYSIRRMDSEAVLVTGRGFRVTGTTPDVAIDQPFTSIQFELELPEAQIPDVTAFNHYLPQRIGLVMRSGAGTVHGRLAVSTAQTDCEGELFLDGQAVRATLDELSMSAEVAVHAVIKEGNIAAGTYDISGSRMDLRGVRIESGGSSRGEKDDSAGWWAEASLPSGHVTMGAPTFLSGSLGLTCRDTVPFITIFSEKNKLPGWVRGLLNARPVRGTAQIRMGDDSFRVSRLHLLAGGFEVLLELHRRRQTEGKLFARHGTLSMAMSIAHQENKVKLLKARKWYDAEPDP